MMDEYYYDDPEFNVMMGEIDLTLEDGETYADIANAFEITMEAIAGLNPEIDMAQQPTPGRQIRLPYRTCPGGTIYTVRRGDTLASIANRYGITEAALRQANPFLNGIRLRPGLPICIPPRRTVRCPGGFIYTIAAGDTLFALANRYGTTVAAILRANPGIDPNRLFIGQRICIPVSRPSPTPQPPRPGQCPNGFFYTIVAGDTLYRLAIRFNTTVEAILRANPGIDPNRLFVGQRICIPGRRPRATEQSEYMDYYGTAYYPEELY